MTYSVTELNENDLENINSGIGAKPPKRRDTFFIKTLADFLLWITEKLA